MPELPSPGMERGRGRLSKSYNYKDKLRSAMTVVEKIIENINILPESKQVTILNFVEYIKQKSEIQLNNVFSEFSLLSAMKGMENEEPNYSQSDII